MATDLDPHLSEDLLAAAALGDALTTAQHTHLNRCAPCRLHVSELLEIVALGQEDSDADLGHSTPPDIVWEAISTAVGEATVISFAAAADRGTGAAHNRRGARGERTRHRRGPLLMAAAAVTGVLVGAGLVAAVDTWRSDPTVVASATLAPVPGGPTVGQTGAAQIERISGGDVLAISTSDLADPTGYYEVWLLDPASGGMIAMGVVPGDSGTATLPVPPGVDLTQYAAVDISDEPMDGNPGHSSVSVLRGELAT